LPPFVFALCSSKADLYLCLANLASLNICLVIGTFKGPPWKVMGSATILWLMRDSSDKFSTRSHSLTENPLSTEVFPWLKIKSLFKTSSFKLLNSGNSQNLFFITTVRDGTVGGCILVLT
jgi:hypothetical protein